MTDQAKPNSYDEVLYRGAALPPTHPNALATLATLFGMNPNPVTRSRVLELGCATGGNLIPMAYGLPDSQFIGIDLSARQINEGQAVIETLGLRNIELKHMSILDVDEDFGQFDYIITYGVYSWVPSAVQEAILAICKRNLAPQGVAFISYNTYPGWHMRGAVRDMMLYHSKHFDGLMTQGEQAWGLLKFLVEATAQLSKHVPHVELYSNMLQREQELLRAMPHFYLMHEHLEEVNDPIYFHQFAERAARHGLQYLADSDVATMMTGTLPPEIGATVEAIAPHRIAVEQYLDFLFNRTFRQSLLCHEDIALESDLTAPSLSPFQLASSATLVQPDETGYAPDKEKVRTASGSVLSLKSPLARAALRSLVESWPEAMPFDELLATARRRIGSDAADLEDDPRNLSETMMKCYAMGAVELRVHTPALVVEAGERPLASAVARLQAQRKNIVSNLLHTRLSLDAPSLALLPYLDGNHDRAMLQDILERLVEEGQLVLEKDQEPVEDVAKSKEMLAGLLDQILHSLARQALLLS